MNQTEKDLHITEWVPSNHQTSKSAVEAMIDADGPTMNPSVDPVVDLMAALEESLLDAKRKYDSRK